MISYERLLEVFWSDHDPTALPWSRQYAVILFFHDEAQKAAAERTRDAIARRLAAPVRTAIRPYTGFTTAEAYHQKYSLRHHRAEAEAFQRMYGSQREAEAALLYSTAAARLNGWVAGQGTVADCERELPELGLPPEVAGKLLETLREREARRRPKPAGCR